MKDVVYLVVNRNGVVGMRKRHPDLAGGEVGIKLTVKVPDAHFRDPYAVAELELGEEHLIHPTAHVEVESPPEAVDDNDHDPEAD
jgi:hypothetical protein